VLKNGSRETPYIEEVGMEGVFWAPHSTAEMSPSMTCPVTLPGTGERPGRHLLSWMCWCWSVLATWQGCLLFSRVGWDPVKNHTEQQSHQTEGKLCGLCQEKSGIQCLEKQQSWARTALGNWN